MNLGRPVDFEKDVAPILEANCLACHNSAISESKLSVETADSIRKGGNAARLSHRRVLRPASCSKSRRGPSSPPCRRFPIRSKPMPSLQRAGHLETVDSRRGTGRGDRRHDSIQWQPIPSTMKSIESVALSPWGRFAAAARTNQVVIYDLILGQETARLVDPLLSSVQFDGHSMYPAGAADHDFIHSLAFSPDGTLLAAGGYRVVKLWRHPHERPQMDRLAFR